MNKPENALSHADIATARIAALLVAQSRYVEMPHAMSLYAPKSKNMSANMLSRNPSMKIDQKLQKQMAWRCIEDATLSLFVLDRFLAIIIARTLATNPSDRNYPFFLFPNVPADLYKNRKLRKNIKI